MTEPATQHQAARVCFRIPGQPVAKGRARSSAVMCNGKQLLVNGRPVVRHHTPEKTVIFENLVKMAAREAMGARSPFAGPVRLVVEIALAIPASWSRKRQAMAETGQICATKKPDADNVLKAVKDGMNGIVWVDDCQAVEYHISKKYSASPGVYVEAMELPLERA
jgi:Holliday junction resolvase RusA-like endonuclease